jgi:tRNA(His) 5'-end guanylyltransferase
MQAVLREFPVVLGYGESDEYSFVLNKDTTLYGVPQLLPQQYLGVALAS